MLAYTYINIHIRLLRKLTSATQTTNEMQNGQIVNYPNLYV